VEIILRVSDSLHLANNLNHELTPRKATLFARVLIVSADVRQLRQSESILIWKPTQAPTPETNDSASSSLDARRT